MRSGVFFSVIGGDFEVMLPMMNGSLRLKMRIEDFDGGVEDRSMKWTGNIERHAQDRTLVDIASRHIVLSHYQITDLADLDSRFDP